MTEAKAVTPEVLEATVAVAMREAVAVTPAMLEATVAQAVVVVVVVVAQARVVVVIGRPSGRRVARARMARAKAEAAQVVQRAVAKAVRWCRSKWTRRWCPAQRRRQQGCRW